VRKKREGPSTTSVVTLGLITFVLVAALETAIFIAMFTTAVIGITQHASDMVKSSIAFTICFFIIPFLGQMIVDRITGDDQYEEARLRAKHDTDRKKRKQ